MSSPVVAESTPYSIKRGSAAGLASAPGSADTPVRNQGPGGSLPGPDAGHPLHGAGGHQLDLPGCEPGTRRWRHTSAYDKQDSRPVARPDSNAPPVNGDEVWAVRFSAGEFEAYEAREVDDLLRRVAAELDAGRPAGPLIESARFWRRRENFRTRATQGYDVEAVDWFLSHLLLPPDRSKLAGIGGDPWRDLGDVAQLTRSEAGGAAKHRRVQAWLASDKHFAGECANAWRDFGREPGTHLLCGHARGATNCAPRTGRR